MKHDFYLDSFGERNDFRIDTDRCNGPQCRVCGDSFCVHCDDERIDEDCPGVDRAVSVTVSISHPGASVYHSDRQAISERVVLSPGEIEAAADGDMVVQVLLRSVDAVRGHWEARS